MPLKIASHRNIKRIRADLLEGKLSQADIVRKYLVNKTSVSRLFQSMEGEIKAEACERRRQAHEAMRRERNEDRQPKAPRVRDRFVERIQKILGAWERPEEEYVQLPVTLIDGSPGHAKIHRDFHGIVIPYHWQIVMLREAIAWIEPGEMAGGKRLTLRTECGVDDLSWYADEMIAHVLERHGKRLSGEGFELLRTSGILFPGGKQLETESDRLKDAAKRLQEYQDDMAAYNSWDSFDRQIWGIKKPVHP
jgi:AcrR family transcriptional regulator